MYCYLSSSLSVNRVASNRILNIVFTCHLFCIPSPAILKMITAEHSSNNGNNLVTKKPNILKELIETYALELTPREKIGLEVIHISIKTDVSR